MTVSVPFYVAVAGNEIVYVGHGKPVEALPDDTRLISGLLAQTLYRAIAGHNYTELKETHGANRCMTARRQIYNCYLSGERYSDGELDAAQKALLKFDDDFYWPGFWQPELQEDGTLVLAKRVAAVELPELKL